MSKLRPGWKHLVLLLLCTGLRLGAQEFTFLMGLMTTANLKESSYTWQVDYCQDFHPYFAASIGYLNEGHVVGHHRDGSAFELWARLPFWKDRLSVSLGVGPYYYYDTQYLPNGTSANVHGTAPIFSLAATGYLPHRWYYQLRLNRTNPAHQIKLNTAALGVGYWFGRGERPTRGKLGDAPDIRGYVTENQLTLFGGQSVVNTFLSESALASAIEYRRGLKPHLDLTATLVHEGDPEIIRRSGFATQAWLVNTFFDERVSVGFGLGPYVYLDRKNPRAGNSDNPAAVAPLASLTISVRITEHLLVRAILHRVTTSYNRDSDVFLLGFGYRWPR